jgi:serine/threonine-protein kinase
MNRCPTCLRIYTDPMLKFCREDGDALVTTSMIDTASQPTIDLSQPGAQTTHISFRSAPSIAVLPFVHMSSDPDNDYFCDGLAEELLNALVKVEGLKVASRTSSFYFKGKDIKISEVGEALNVSTVLEGSVRKSGGRLRITAQLINVEDGYHLWSERYDRQLKDLFDIQDEITLAVVDALKVTLLGKEKSVLLKRYTDNSEVYELYLKGRYYLNKFTTESWAKAIGFLEEAIRLEPDYAPAHAAIAIYWSGIWYYSLRSPQEIVPKWKAAASRALEIDSDLSDAHLSMANIRFYYERNWNEAEQEYKRAIELNPGNADAHWCYGLFLVSREQFDQAFSEGEKARELDPLAVLTNVQVGWIYWLSNKLDDAFKQAEKLIELEPAAFSAYWLRGGIYLAKGMHEESIEAHKKSMDLGGNNMGLSALGLAYSVADRRDEALGVLNHLLETRKHQYISAFDIARIYVGLKENDSAFEWLEKACEERNGEIVFLKVITKALSKDKVWEGVHKDPRFPDLLRRVGLSI